MSKDLKIGLGITTTPNRVINSDLILYTSPETLIHVHTDTDKVGVAKSRNNAIKYLYDQGCDIIFISDDDVIPIMSGWEDYFVNAHLQSGIHHFALPESFKNKLLRFKGEIGYYDGCIGAFRMITRQFIETVGYFNTAYDTYGFEDAGMTERFRRSGLGSMGPDEYPCPLKAVSYIFSEDVYNRNPAPNLTYEEKLAFIRKNKAIYYKEIKGPIYYPYE